MKEVEVLIDPFLQLRPFQDYALDIEKGCRKLLVLYLMARLVLGGACLESRTLQGLSVTNDLEVAIIGRVSDILVLLLLGFGVLNGSAALLP